MNFKKLLLIFFILLPLQSIAGKSCESSILNAEDTTKAINLSSKLLDTINAYGDDNTVFLIGRRGQNLDEYNQKFSHGAFVYKNSNNWILTHVLNSCGSDESSVYQDGVGNFFIDSMYKYETAISAFGQIESQKIREFLLDSEKVKKTHVKKYNMLSHPFSSRYQNSNSWLIESFFAANFNLDIDNRELIHEKIKDEGYTGQLLEINPLKRLGARITKANIAFDDQPFADRMNNKIVTVTYDSIIILFSQKGWLIKTVYL